MDAARRCVRTDAGDEIGYDHLLLCCGVGADYFGIPGAAEHARTVYTRADAIGSGTRCSATWRPTPRAAPRPSSR